MYSVKILALLLCFILRVDGIMWKLKPNTQKCLREELQSNVLVTGDYEVSEAPGQKVDYVVCRINKNLFKLIYLSNLLNAMFFRLGNLKDIFCLKKMI